MNISKDTDLAYESSKSMLLVEESHRITNGGGSLNDTTLVARSRFEERDGGGKDQDQYKSRGKNNGKCWNCGKKDHLRKDCKLNLKTNPQTSNRSGANITEEENSYEYAEVLFVVQHDSMKDQ